jgi:hypothetical protein
MTVNLLKYTYKDIDLFYSDEMKEQEKLDNEISLEVTAMMAVKNLLEQNKEYSELVETYAKKNSLENIAILYAHGEEINNKWHYFSNDKAFSVQRWINKMDGKYKALIIYSCNPGGNEITSKKSIVLAPNRLYSGKIARHGEVNIELFLPGTGYVDSYMIEEIKHNNA